MTNKVQLITYVDRFGSKDVHGLTSLFEGELKELFGGVHILPFYYPIDGEDAGFDPIDHLSVDPRLGSWADIGTLSNKVEIMADLIVNHISAKSPQFKDFIENGKESKFSDLFLSYGKVFGKGAPEADLLKIYRPRPGLPFTAFTFANGTSKLMWTTFTSNQIDIDVHSNTGKAYLDSILSVFQQSGIKMIRLDAAGYAIKKPGSSCFMIDETFDFIAQLSNKAREKGIKALVEIHSHYLTQIEIAKKVDYVYDFALPVLVMDTLFNRNAANLKNWIKIRPENAFTVLDTHDGIGIVDVASEGNKPGLINDSQLNAIVEKIHTNSNGESLKATGAAASNLDLYQVNCTYYDALGGNDKAYLMARAIQLFIPGIPQIYYVGLLAQNNDMELLAKTRVGRDINRHYFSKDEITSGIKKPVVKKLIELIRARNMHPAFDGEFSLIESNHLLLKMEWRNADDWAILEINLEADDMHIGFSQSEGIYQIKL